MNSTDKPREKEDFSRLSVKGFRRLHDIDIPLRPLSVMIGANGVGKTSLLDVGTDRRDAH
jgi:predicted ATPase